MLRVNAAFGSGRAPGVYVVEACADVDHRVAESNEADNCKHVALVRVSGTPGIAPVEVEDADDPDEPDPVDGPDVPEDTTPPDTTMDSAPSGSVNDGPQSVSFHASEAGSTLECRLDAGLWASCTTKVQHANDMQDAVMRAFNAAEAGDVVLLAPACASFDMFESFEHRGQVFKDHVQSLTSKAQSLPN